MQLEIDLLLEIELKLLEHDASNCTRPPYLILLNPGNFAILGWDEIMGLPVLPDSRVPPMSCKLVCGERGWGGSFEGQTVWWISGKPYVEIVPAAVPASVPA